MPEHVRLDPSDAKFVDAYHTDIKTILLLGLSIIYNEYLAIFSSLISILIFQVMELNRKWLTWTSTRTAGAIILGAIP